jgi:hypothetical protein
MIKYGMYCNVSGWRPVQETDGKAMDLTVSSKVGNFYSAFLILFSINVIHTIFEISVPVSQKRSESLLSGPYVMEIIAIYWEGHVAQIHTLRR